MGSSARCKLFVSSKPWRLSTLPPHELYAFQGNVHNTLNVVFEVVTRLKICAVSPGSLLKSSNLIC